MEIKKIEYSELLNKQEELLSSLKNTGFAILTGEPLSANFLNKIYDSWKDYFRSPLDSKLKDKFDPNQLQQSGYFPYKTENAKGESLPDLKEFYHIYKSQDAPEELQNDIGMLLTGVTITAMGLLNIIGQDIDYDGNLGDSIINGNSLMRAIYYPEIEDNEQGVRAAAHEDINFITLLPASTNPGLQVKDNEGVWHDVGTESGDLIINVGDMLQMFSKGKYKSTTHRVINLPGDRLSMPFFVHPHSDFDLGDMTAKEYLTQRLQEIGLK